jgi:hypothetical protein
MTSIVSVTTRIGSIVAAGLFSAVSGNAAKWMVGEIGLCTTSVYHVISGLL